MYLSGDLLPRASSYGVRMFPFSDNGLVSTKLQSRVARHRRRLRGFWKMNMAIVDYQEFSAEVRQRLEHIGNAVDACAWEFFKGELRELFETFSRTKAIQARQEERVLTKTLRMVLEEEEKSPRTFTENIRH